MKCISWLWAFLCASVCLDLTGFGWRNCYATMIILMLDIVRYIRLATLRSPVGDLGPQEVHPDFFPEDRHCCLQMEKQLRFWTAITLDPAVERSVLVGEVQLCVFLVLVVRFMINFGHCRTSGNNEGIVTTNIFTFLCCCLIIFAKAVAYGNLYMCKPWGRRESLVSNLSFP